MSMTAGMLAETRFPYFGKTSANIFSAGTHPSSGIVHRSASSGSDLYFNLHSQSEALRIVAEAASPMV
jgi:hypothetical protein